MLKPRITWASFSQSNNAAYQGFTWVYGCDAAILLLVSDAAQAQPVRLSPSHALWHKIDTNSENNTENKEKLGESLDPSEWCKMKIHENFLCHWNLCVIETLGPSFLLQKCGIKDKDVLQQPLLHPRLLKKPPDAVTGGYYKMPTQLGWCK